MGKIRTKLVKNTANKFLNKTDKFCDNFQKNKAVLDELGVASSKRLRNKIAGYITHKFEKDEKA